MSSNTINYVEKSPESLDVKTEEIWVPSMQSQFTKKNNTTCEHVWVARSHPEGFPCSILICDICGAKG